VRPAVRVPAKAVDAAPDDEAPPEELYRVASAAIRRVLGPGYSESDDLVQKALERVVRSIKTSRFAGDCSLPTWVTIVARHVAIDERRAQRTLDRSAPRSLLPMAGLAAPQDLERQLEARSLLTQAMRVLESMDELTADIIVMHDFAGHSLPEVALATRTSVAAAQSRLVRGRKLFVQRLMIILKR
jgi:RNA polymerase sigma factor (sigma-70 family)